MTELKKAGPSLEFRGRLSEEQVQAHQTELDKHNKLLDG